MPPSPLPRRSPSPARETCYKRSNSFGSSLPVKPKDDELTLFSDMQKVEREIFLLEPSEDFDRVNCKIELFFQKSSWELNIPAPGEGHDLLNADGDKNDYECLLLVFFSDPPLCNFASLLLVFCWPWPWPPSPIPHLGSSYLLALSGVFFAGVNQVAVSVWAGPARRLRPPHGIAAGRKLVRASLLAPLVNAAGIKVASLLP